MYYLIQGFKQISHERHTFFWGWRIGEDRLHFDLRYGRGDIYEER